MDGRPLYATSVKLIASETCSLLTYKLSTTAIDSVNLQELAPEIKS